ncbi:MAG: conjugal transfer protein [Chromatiaceae bacterium]|nr:conjugal transfer protein [Chromatiaceae bacterium]
MGITRFLIAGTIAATFATSPVLADADAEHEALARLIHELKTLEPMIRSAESQANPDARIRFRYDWLRQDLARMRSGVQEHIDAHQAEPRTFPPLRGDYRR